MNAASAAVACGFAFPPPQVSAMPAKTISALEPYLNEAQKTLEPKDFGADGKWSIICRRHRGGLSDGVDTIVVQMPGFRFTVIPTRGMGLWHAAIGKLVFGWKSPVRGPVHPAFVDLGEPSGLGWLDGFDELL